MAFRDPRCQRIQAAGAWHRRRRQALQSKPSATLGLFQPGAILIEFVVNLKTGKALPPSLTLRADQAIRSRIQ
jgi:hypothetical protein